MKENKGITLIALIITIIVILILAGISIAMLAGNNSILNRAGQSRVANALGAAKDNVNIAVMAAVQDYYQSVYDATSVNGTYTQSGLDKYVTDHIKANNSNSEYNLSTIDVSFGNWSKSGTGASITLTYTPDSSSVTGTLENGVMTWGAINSNGQVDENQNTETVVEGSISDWVLNDAKDAILFYIGGDITEDTFVIPNYVDGNKISYIGEGAPIWVQKGGPTSFMVGKKLQISEGITQIRNNAFVNCQFSGDLILPTTISTIGESVFTNCTGLTGRLVIPYGVQTIGNNAFRETRFETIEIDAENIVDGWFVPFDPTNGRAVNTTCESIVLGTHVRTIGNYVFAAYTGASSITIGENVETIGNFAFSGCTNANLDITVPSGVTSVGTNAFENVERVHYSGTLNYNSWGAKKYNDQQ